MNIIVFDLEWNQSDSNSKQERPAGQPVFEIIEIGAVKLNEKREMLGKFSQLIKPQIYHTMHKITAGLVQIEMADLKQGKTFPEVFEEFIKWCGEDYIFATWGPLDLLELQRNMKYYHLEPLSEGPIKFYDVQKMFSIDVLKEKERKTLEFAIDHFQIEKDIPFHRAFSDAYYTAKVLEKLENPDILQFISFDTYHLPQDRKQEVKMIFPNYAKHISREFEHKQDIMEDKEISSTKCHLCHKNLKKKIKWHTLNGKHYYSVSFCDVHGYIKHKVRIRKSENEKYYAVKTSKFISKEKMEKLNQMWLQEKEAKKKKKNMLPNQK